MIAENLLVYDIPMFVFVILAIYTIYQLKMAKSQLGKSPISRSYQWFITAAVFFLLWALIHIYDDLFIPTGNLKLFLHYIISHGFLVISMICIAIAARKTQEFVYSWKEGK